MGEVGYKRGAKKCKEKFENVHKYYKRTKEGRVGRQDGKTYKFFGELEALQTSTPSSAFPPLLPPARTLPPAPPPTATVNLHASSPVSTEIQLTNLGVPVSVPVRSMVAIPSTVSSIFPATTTPASSPLGLIFSSKSSSSSQGSDNYEDDVEGQPSTEGSNRKRKRATETSSGLDGQRMMEYLDRLMKRVMQQQEEMQNRFLETVEKRERDRLAREEAWRRQEIARLTREQELMAQERVVSASRDAAIMSFLQKITGQTIQLTSMATVTAVPVVSPRPLPPSQVPAATPPPSSRRQQHQQPQRQPTPPPMHYPPQQEIIGTSDRGVGACGEIPSSRWPKAEVLALISLRSGMELKYLEVGPKGPLWKEISAGMQRLGYKRNPKRCKEKWENINKYFKKVKESNKKRPEEAKTCPYFHELDTLYRKKVLGNQGSGIEIRLGLDVPENVAGELVQRGGVILADNLERMKNRGPEGEEMESTNKPEYTVKEINRHLEQQQARVFDFRDKADGQDDDQENENEDNLEEDEDEDEEMEEDRKMAYKIEYQQRRQNARPPNGSESGSSPPFAAMVQ